MKVRLRDFAELHRISERTVQVHIKNNQEALEGHIDRRGKQGTWLDEFAVEFLLDRIQLPKTDEVLVLTPREAALTEKVAAISIQLADAERRAGENAEAAGKVKLLEESKASQDAQICHLSAQVGQWTQRATTAEETAQRASERAERAEQKAKAMREYILACEAYQALGWFARRRTKAPELPPELLED